jgi:hypothetical protein
MVNFLHKKKWSEIEWDIFYINIKHLMHDRNLKNCEFSETLGVKNFFSYEILPARHKAPAPQNRGQNSTPKITLGIQIYPQKERVREF